MRAEPPALLATAVIALGSNQGDREELLREAVRAIDALNDVRVVAASDIVETPALKLHGVDETAPSYLNAVVIADVALEPEELLRQLHGIEASLGRVRGEVWGDRTIDLDLIDFGGMTRHNDTITLPHPRAWKRAFVLAPWLNVQPDAVLARQGPTDGVGNESSRDGRSSAAPDSAAPDSAAPDHAAPVRIADLLAATTDRVTNYPAPPLMEVLDR